MEKDREKRKQIRNFVILAIILILVIQYSRELISAVVFLADILKPFLYGGIIAFILNIPMSAFEKKVFQNRNGKYAEKWKRPVSVFLAILIVIGILTVIVMMILPRLADSLTEIGRKIPDAFEQLQTWLRHITKNNPTLAAQLDEYKLEDVKWEDVMEKVIHFMKNGAGDLLSSTFSMVGGIISGVVDSVIAFVFAIYILAQKEKLSNQIQRVIQAYLPEKRVREIQKVCSLLNTNFTNFITGQCLEAVILGSLFIIAMTILRLPYALVIGILIALTALIPIAGAWIGCAVGFLLILIEDSVQAIVFLILFFVLQQIEGKLIYPKVVGNFVGLPGIWVLVAITVGGSLFGIIGMLVFIPLTATAYSLLRDSVNRRNAEKVTGENEIKEMMPQAEQPEKGA
jgi:predicted PurR-regulated permease PerM